MSQLGWSDRSYMEDTERRSSRVMNFWAHPLHDSGTRALYLQNG